MPSPFALPRPVVTPVALLAVLATVPQMAWGQLSRPDSAEAAAANYVELPAPPNLETCIHQGLSLEQSGKWAPAIEHYQKALETFPDNRKLKYGLRRARIHFGIHRRYADPSFTASLLSKSPSAALALFDDIYRMIRSSYFEPVSITSFTAHGTESLYLALGNEKFLARNLPEADPAAVAEVRHILRQRYWNKRASGLDAAHAAIEEVTRLTQSRLGLSATAVIMEYVFGGCNALDKYSNVLTPNSLDDLYGNIDGEFVGLGIEMVARQGKGMLLLDVLPNSPAEAGGMRPGEFIVAINGTNCRNMSADEAAALLRGPPGSSVTLRLVASSAIEANPQPWVGQFVRRPVVVKSIDRVRMLDSAEGIGYIRICGFQKSTAEELDAALASLRRQGMRKLILDLRGNPGGLLTAAVEVLDRFIADGVLVSTRGPNLNQNWTYSAHASGTRSEIELAVLIDGESASASEIVAGAIQDHQRGVLVGQTSYGKWCVQTIMPMSDQLGMRLTTARFYSPDGHNYSGTGIVPDIVAREDPNGRSASLTQGIPQIVFGFHPEQDAGIQAALRSLRGEQRELTQR